MAEPASVPQSVADAFALFDVNGDGSLSVEELQEVLQRPGGGAPLSDEEVKAVIAEFDDNGDGVLQIEEFAKMWAPMLSGAVSLDDEDDEDDGITKSVSSATTTPNSSEADVERGAAAPPAPAKKKKKSAIAGLRASFTKGSLRDSFKKATAKTSASFSRRSKKPKEAKGGAPADKMARQSSVRGQGSRSALAAAGAPPSAEELRCSGDLRTAAVAEDEHATALDAQATKSEDGENFERKLGGALAEHEQARAAMAGSKQALADLIRSWDKNGDGEISTIEFRQAVRNQLGVRATNDEIDELFKSFDADGSGKLDLKELRPALKALQDAAVAGRAEAASRRSMAEECRARAQQLRAAAESMSALERDERAIAAAHAAAQSVASQLAGLMVRRNLKVDDVLRGWPGVASIPGEPMKVTRPNFLKGLKDLKVHASEKEAEAWFFEALQEGGFAAPGSKVPQLLLKGVLLDCLSEHERRRDELAATEKSLAAHRKAAKEQQSTIEKMQAAAREQMRKSETAAAQAAAEREAAELDAKKAKFASFKRKKDKKAKEKEEFEKKVVAKRQSWTKLEDHFATLTPTPIGSARGAPVAPGAKSSVAFAGEVRA